MSVRPITPVSADLPVGGVWAMVVSVTDTAGAPVTDAPTVAVTLPGDVPAAPVATEVTAGIWRASLVTTVTGRYVARVTTTDNGSVDFAAYVVAVVPDSGMPDITDVDIYLGEHSWDDDALQDALDAEAANQRRVCSVPAAYGADLRQALLRRVQVNLAKRGQPFLTVPDSEVVSLIPKLDAEINRFEGPYRRLVMG